MKINFLENYHEEDPRNLQVKIKNSIIENLEYLGDMEYYLEKIDIIMKGVNQGLLKISSEQYGDKTSLYKKSIKYNQETSIHIGEVLESCIDNALDKRIHSTTLERILDYTMDTLETVAKEVRIEHENKFKPVDPNKELEHIIEYIEKRWEGFDKIDIQAFFTQIWEKSLELSKYKIDNHGFMDLYEEWNNERKDHKNWQKAGSKLSEEDIKSFSLYDYPQNLIYSILSTPTSYDDVIMSKWDYSTNVKELLKEIKEVFPEATKLLPIGWKNLAKNYRDFDGQEEYCETQQELDDKEFKGINSGTAGTFPFQARVALPYVMYDDKCQGRKPLHTLIGAILGHAYALNIKNNTIAVLKDLYDIKKELSTPTYYQDIVLSFDIESKLTTPVMRGLYEAMKKNLNIVSESEFQKAKKEREEALKNPPTEKEIAKNRLDFTKKMKEMFSRVETAEEIAQRQKEKKELEERVWSALNEREVGKKSKVKIK